MTVCRGCFAVVFASLAVAVCADAYAAPGAEGAAPGCAAVQEEIRRAMSMAEEAHTGLGRALDQGERLAKLLEETRAELQLLREEVNRLRGNVPGGVAHGASAQTGALGLSPVPEAGVPPVPPSGVAGRLERLEEQVDVNTAQIREQAQTKVESDSKYNVRLFGTVLFNTFYNTRDSAVNAVPLTAPPGVDRIAGGRNLGATVRQTSFGFATAGPRLGGARVSADADFDFYGGTPGAYGSDVLGALRMRTARARLDGRDNSVAVGLMEPMVSPLSPASLAAVYYPALGESGNLWQWLPQAVVEHRTPLSESGTFTVQGGLIMPFGENFYGRGLEGRPGYQFRSAFARRMDADRRMQAGLGGYIQPRYFGFDRKVNSFAVTGDWVVPVGSRLEVSGEAYYGQSITLGASSGADISALFGYTGSLDKPASALWGIRSAGGWLQLRARATPTLEFNAAYGVDDPRNRDILRGLFRSETRLANRTFSLNSIYRLRSNFLFSLEYRRLRTFYPGARPANNHVNLAVGYLF